MIRVRQIFAVLCVATLLASLCTYATAPRLIQAGDQDTPSDSDGDFLPDTVEWVVLTDATNPDTDGDGCPDFVEVVQRGSPRHPGVTVAPDHELRVVLTGPRPGNPLEVTRLHLFFRFFGGVNLLSSFSLWLESPLYPGLEVPLNMVASAAMEIDQRATANDGLWVHVAVPLVSQSVLEQLLPCSIRVAATIGGNEINTGVYLMDVAGDICALVPFGDGRFVMQTIGLRPLLGQTSNRVCVLALEAAGSGNGGTLYEIVDADCESCNELECGPSCQQSIGWMINIPGGVQGL